MDEIIEVFDLENTKEIFEILETCKGVPQMPKWHPEGDVFTHSLQTLHYAFKESEDVDLILAAMLHDVGKSVTSLGHEQIGYEILEPCCSIKTRFLVLHHMRICAYLNGEMRRRSKCVFLATHPWLPELVQLTRWDHLARNPKLKVEYNKVEIIKRLNKVSMMHFKIPEHLKKQGENENVDGTEQEEL